MIDFWTECVMTSFDFFDDYVDRMGYGHFLLPQNTCFSLHTGFGVVHAHETWAQERKTKEKMG